MLQRVKRYKNAGKDYFEYSSKHNEPFENEALSKQDLYREKGDITGYIKFLEELKPNTSQQNFRCCQYIF